VNAEHEQPAAAHAFTGSGADREQEVMGTSLLAPEEPIVNLPNEGLTPPQRNNDSRKTSGANTPNKEGADTPTTHLSQSFNMQNRVYGHAGAGAGVTTTQDQNEFGSAVTAGLNAHLASQSSNQ